MLCEFWGLDQVQQDAWWAALRTARWSVAVAWRERVRAAEGPCRTEPASPLARTPLQHARVLVHTACAPHAVVAVVEALVGEGALTRPCASALEEVLLRAVDSQGRWCDHCNYRVLL